MTIFLFLLFVVITSPVNGAFWSRSETHSQHVAVKEGHRVVIKFGEEINGETKVFISEHESSGTGEAGGLFVSPKKLFNTCKRKLASVFKTTDNVFLGKTHESENSEDDAKEVTSEAVPEKNLFKKIMEKVKFIADKGMDGVFWAPKYVIGQTLGLFGESAKGSLKDSVVKMDEWDLVDSPKRIGEDIERNATRKIVEGVEQVEETLETVKESSVNDLITKSKEVLPDVMFKTTLEKIKSVISWCHLFGFSIAYGMGIWMTFSSKCLLSKCLPKQQFGMVLNKINMVYFKAMAYCVGAALLGYLVSHGRKGVFFNRMEIFQGFNLVCALIMILINLLLLEPRATKLIVERMKIPMKEKKQMKTIMKQLRRLNAYSSTLNVSTMVVLTWHLAYMGQLLRARH
uniref:uncharacterized protein LOC122608829 n=1 Tax=Erigeron canadensis TaxID=72917 RepID=UPI001CB9945B|nr:uncharacterized protein LOC122608829 [Erigeron canadensis]